LKATVAPAPLTKVVTGGNTQETGPKVNVQGWTLAEDPKGIDAMDYVKSGYKNPDIKSGLISKVGFMLVLAVSFMLN